MLLLLLIRLVLLLLLPECGLQRLRPPPLGGQSLLQVPLAVLHSEEQALGMAQLALCVERKHSKEIEWTLCINMVNREGEKV